MYSYADRVRAVRLYIKLGQRTAAAIHQLGYPTKNALKSWHREFERCCDLPAGYARLKPKYSAEQKMVVQRLMKQERLVVARPKRRRYAWSRRRIWLGSI